MFKKLVGWFLVLSLVIPLLALVSGCVWFVCMGDWQNAAPLLFIFWLLAICVAFPYWMANSED
jgi:hypothetical protein